MTPLKQFVVPPSGGENRLKPELQTELWALVAAMCDGTIAAEDLARLESLLRGDEEARLFYAAYMDLHGRLLWRFREGGRRGNAEGGMAGDDSFAHEGNAVTPSEVPPPAPAVSPIIIRTSPALPSGAFSLSSPLGGWLLSYAVATVITGAAILGAWVYKVSQESGASVSSEQVVNTGHPLLTPGKTESGLVGQITGMSECRWAGPQDAPAAAVPLGRKYELAAGLVEISYQSGAKVILQGPCTYEVDSVAGGFLSRGKLTARVEHGSEFRGQGSEHYPLSTSHYPLFSVRTPTAVVTDLGTEFGVEVTREGNTDARVFQGAVRVAAAADNGSASHERVCRAGEMVCVGAGEPVIRTIAPAKGATVGFVRAMPPPKTARDSQAYAELVLSLKPVVYYRMERPGSENDRFVVFDSAPGGHHGELRLGNEYGGSPYRPGRFGDALWLRGWETGDRVFVRDYPKAAHGKLTVAAWVMAMNRPGVAMIANNWGATDGAQFELGLHGYDGDLYAHASQRDGRHVEVREGASCPLPMFVWQHVALVADGTRLHLYRNGTEVASGACVGLLFPPPVVALCIGSRTTNAQGTDADPPVPGHHYWQGRIDELAIFNDALSAEQIQSLCSGIMPLEREAKQTRGEPMNGP